MTAQEIDISWQVLRQVVRDWAGASAELAEFQPLAGGSVSTTLCLTLADGRKAVLKITPHRVDRSYADERCQLALMREAGVPVPEVYACHAGSLEAPFSYLLMEFVPGVDLGAARHACPAEQFDALQAHLAELLLRLHANTAAHFMRVSAAEGKRYDRWPAFYREVFDPIWRDVERASLLPVKARKTVAKVHARLDQLLAHDDPPRLIHWDMWNSNVLARQEGGDAGPWRVCAMLDPACMYGHAEAELAYMELFHTATPAFMKAYQHHRRLPPEYHRVRRPVYQLYSLLNHLHLFGPHEYLKPVLAQVEKVAPLV